MTMKRLSLLRTCLPVAALTALLAQADIKAPLHIGTAGAIVDERGQTLPGTSATAALFGQPVVVGDVVQIIRTYNGLVDAPDTNGIIAGTNNVIVAITRIGEGVNPAAGQTGQFGLSLADYDGGALFARVFNAPAVAAASFYADSQVYAPAAEYSQFIPVLAAVQPLDSQDDDGEGLINSWEKSLGTSPGQADTDGDGMDDYREFLSGTDGDNAGDYLRMVGVMPALNGDAIIYWASVPGKSYQVEFTDGDLAASPTFTAVGAPVTADGATTQVTHPAGLTFSNARYRVKLVP